MTAIRRWYFPLATGLMLALTLIGFSDNLFTNVRQPSNFDPKFIVHGFLCLAWMAALFAQACLIARRDLRLHQRIGRWLFPLAIGVTLSTLYVFWVNWPGWAALDPEAKSNRLFLPSTALLVWLAWRARRQPDRHRRLIYIATLYMLGPVIARAYDPGFVPLLPKLPTATIDALFLPFFFSVWFAFFASLLLYDFVVTKRVHTLSALGALWFAMVWTIAYTV